MSTSIPVAFVDLFGSETKLAYQRKAAKLRALFTNVSGVGGDTFRFPKLGAGVANQKARHADVTPMNLAHSNVVASLADYFAPEYVDELDLLKTNESVREKYTMSAAMALGRQADQIGIDAWDLGATDLGSLGSTLTVAAVDTWRETLDEADVDADNRFAVIAPQAVSNLLQLSGDEFISSELRGSAGPNSANEGMPIGRWRGFNWHVHTGLPLATGGPDLRTVFVGHPSSSGFVSGKEITTTMDWIAEKVAWLINAKLSMGSVVIDAPGILKQQINEP